MAHTIETKLGAQTGAPSRSSRALKIVRRTISKTLETIAIWQERAEQRKALRELDPRLLKDIGINRIDAGREAGKPFWLP